MHIYKSTQIQLRLDTGNITLSITAGEDPITIGFHFSQLMTGGLGTHYQVPLNPEYAFLRKGIEAALAGPRVNETDPKVAAAVYAAARELLTLTKNIDPVLDRMLEMNAEYEGWRCLVEEFTQINENINNPKFCALIKAIRLWGERLAQLRQKQTVEECSKALNDAKTMYNLALENLRDYTRILDQQ